MSKVPNARNVLKDYMASRKPTAYYPEGDTFDIPNHSGILANKDAIEGLDERYVNVTGDTMTGDLTMSNSDVIFSGNTGLTWGSTASIIFDGTDLNFDLSGGIQTTYDFAISGTNRFVISASGVDINGSITVNSVSNDTGLAHGTWTPTVTNSTNTDSAVTATTGNYIRLGNRVTGTFQFTADPTTTLTATSFEFSLPVSSNLANGYELGGTAVCGNIASMCAQVTANAGNNTGQVSWIATDVTSQTWTCHFTYQVI